MKNLKFEFSFSAIVLLMMLCFYSCSDKLDEQEGQLNTGDVDYTISEDMILPLIGAYEAFATRGWEEPLLISVRGDDVNAGGLGDQQPFADTDMFNYDNGYWMYNSVWNLHYSDIISVNNALDLIEQYKSFADESDLEKADQYISETKVFRGWLHFNLSRVWGDIFIINTAIPDEGIDDGVKTKDEVMQFVSDLMDEAIPNLPNMRPNERDDVRGGVTKYTALALKAMANLELKNYQGVADATSAIISSISFHFFQISINCLKIQVN